MLQALAEVVWTKDYGSEAANRPLELEPVRRGLAYTASVMEGLETLDLRGARAAFLPGLRGMFGAHLHEPVANTLRGYTDTVRFALAIHAEDFDRLGVSLGSRTLHDCEGLLSQVLKHLAEDQALPSHRRSILEDHARDLLAALRDFEGVGPEPVIRAASRSLMDIDLINMADADDAAANGTDRADRPWIPVLRAAVQSHVMPEVVSWTLQKAFDQVARAALAAGRLLLDP
jgi:hypothetical protein